jgi:hypothetical protein
MEIFVRELEKKQPTYYWPTIAAAMWRMRQRLKQDPQHAQALQAFRWAAHNETAARAICALSVLSWLAEAVTQPDERTAREIAMHKRIFEKERNAWRVLCENNLADVAAPHLREAVKHLVIAYNLANDYVPDRAALLRATAIKLERQFDFRGHAIAARLVSAALNVRVEPHQTRHAVKKIKR